MTTAQMAAPVTRAAVTVRPVAVDEQKQAISALTMAFANDPVMRWMFSGPYVYLSYFPEFARLFGGRAFESGTAYCTDDLSATALWLPAGVQPDEEPLVEMIEECFGEQEQKAMFDLLGQTEQFHPAEPHWYLPLLGVDLSRQGQGAGSALLEYALARCDEQHMPAYLESSSPRNNPLYERFGFEVIGTIQSGDSPTLWPMLRKAR